MALALAASSLRAGAPEFRAQWADAFHHPFANSSTASQIQTCIDNIRAANCNVIIPEVRVYSDVSFVPTPSFYPNLGNASTGIGSINSNGVIINCDLNSDPEPRRTTSIDHLATVLSKAHDTTGGKQRVDVWAWLVAFRSGSTMRNAHPEWLTYTKSTTDNTMTVSDDFDPGHPGVQQQLYNVCMDLVTNYGLPSGRDLDGINFDYIRFTDKSNGYNPVSLQRFRAQYGKPADYIPAYNDADWKQWRRDQVTACVRKVYLNTIAVKPTFKLSGDMIPWGNGPAKPSRTDPNWLATWKTNFEASSSAFNSVYQDWRGWMEEGIVDLAIPMNYNQRCTTETYFENWMDFEKDIQYKKAPDGTIYLNRQLLVGPGTYLNTKEDAIYQMKITRNPSLYRGKYSAGQSMYVYANPFAETCGGALVPDPAAMSAALTSLVVDGTDGQPMYPDKADLPVITRLTNGKGHIKGTVTDPNISSPAWVDGATVTLGTSPARTMKTDGTGFYGFVDVPPGTYSITVSAKNLPTQTGTVVVTAYEVTTKDFVMAPTTPSALRFVTQPGNASEGVPFGTQPVVAAVDGVGATMTSFTGPVTVSVKFGSGNPDAVLSGTTTVNCVNGVATFTDLALSLPGESFVLTAVSGGLSVDSALFNVAAVPVKLVFANEPLDGISNIPFAIQPQVWALDARSAPVTAFNGVVSIGIKPGTGAPGARLKGATSVSAVNGMADFTDLSIDRAGEGYVLVATSGALTPAEAFPVSMSARLIRVSPSGDDANLGDSWSLAMKTPGAALGGVGPGDEIWVAAGTYTGSITLVDGVGVYGGFAGNETERAARNPAANPTILDGDAAGPVVVAEGLSAATVFDGFVLRNGSGRDLDGQTCGGGLFVVGGSPALTNNTVTACAVSGAGGGAWISAATPDLTGCAFSNNRAGRGGGIAVDGPVSLTLRGLTLAGNTSGGIGGGASFHNAVVTLAESVVTGNAAADGGGGVAVTGGAQAVISRCRVTLNGSDFGPGGGLLAEGGALAIENSLLHGNQGSPAGGVAWTAGAAGSLVNATVVANESGVGVGGVFIESNAAVAVNNTIIALNSSGIEASSGTSTFRNNDVHGNPGGNWLGVPDPTGSGGNISADPGFVDATGGDFRLTPGSPCHDAGDTALAPAGSLDLAGAPRRQGWSVDIGAYESAGARPYTLDDVLSALALAAGLSAADASRLTVLDVVGDGDSPGRVDLLDVALLARKVFGIAPNP
jgi:uncharacterized lipoprotein YddW (UPF0748 family)